MNRYSYVKEYKIESPSSAQYKIEDAIIDLIEEGEENISVRTTCLKAGIERETFYAYYLKIEDVKEEIENRVISEALDYDEYPPLSEFLALLLTLCRENRKEIDALLKDNRYSIIEKLSDSVKYYLAGKHIKEYSAENESLLDSIAGAIIYPLLSYIRSGRDINIEEMENLVNAMLKSSSSL